VPVRVRVQFETQEAKEQLEQLQQEAKGGFRELAKLAKESVQLDKVKDAFEGINKVIQATPEGVLGIDAATKQAMATSVDYAEGLSKIGSLFGPIGAVAGGVLGAVAGYFASAEARAEEMRKKVQESAKSIRELRDAAQFGLGFDYKAAISQFEQLNAVLAEADTRAEKRPIWQQLRELRDLTLTSLIKDVEDLDAAAGKTVLDLAGVNKDRPLVELGADALTAGRELREARLRVAALKEEINNLTPSAALERLPSLLMQMAGAQGQVEKAGARAAEAESTYAAAVDEHARKSEEAARKRREAYQRQREEIKAAHDEILGLIAALPGAAKQKEEFNEFVDAVIYGIPKISAEEEALDRLLKGNAANSDEYRERRLANLQTIADAEKAERERKKAELEADFAELQGQYAAALAPFGQIIGATFGQIQKNIEAGNKAFAGVGKAAAAAVGEALKAMAKQWGAQALASVAGGLAALALGPAGGPSAGQYFGGAVVARAAGAGAAASAPPAAASSGGSGSPSLGAGDSRGAPVGGTVVVNLVGNMFLDGDERILAPAGHKLARAIRAAQNDRGFIFEEAA
jgi:hypothetical protein